MEMVKDSKRIWLTRLPLPTLHDEHHWLGEFFCFTLIPVIIIPTTTE